MKSWIKESATSLTALVFLVVGASGVLLYFHLYESRVKELHETLGLLFAAAALLHVYFNWKGMKRYFPRKLFAVYAAAVALTAVVFAASASDGPNPKRLLIDKVLNAPLPVAYALLGTNPEQGRKLLETRGIYTKGTSSIAEIAKHNGVSPFAVVLMFEE